MTLNDVKALVHADFNVKPESQHFFHNQRALVSVDQTLEQLGIHDGDMLGLAIQDPRRQTRHGTRNMEGDTPQNRQSLYAMDPERLRLHIVGDPRVMAEVQRQNPDLAGAANNKERFHEMYRQMQEQAARAEAEKQEQLRLLNEDPFNVEAQRKIEEMIQKERIEENIHKALQENPECKLIRPARTIGFWS